MNKTMRCFSTKKVASYVKPLSVAVAIAASSQAQARSFSLEDIEMEWDSTFTYGFQMRHQERDPTISTNSLGLDGKLDSMSTLIDNAFLLNGDDGNNNFNRGLTSNRFSLLSELDINAGDIGLFVRGKIYYDAVYDKNQTDLNSTQFTTYNPNPRFHTKGTFSNNSAPQGQFQRDSRDYLKSGARLLDVFVYGNWDITEDNSLSWRVGRQVISWGEALMTGGNITTAVNRIDAQIRNVPGLEIKELFLPTGALFGSVNLSDSWNLEAYYQYEWQENILDPSGSYGSEFDSIGDGGNTFIFVNGEEAQFFGWQLDYNQYDQPNDSNSFLEKQYKPYAALLNRFLPRNGCPKGENQRCSALAPFKLKVEEPGNQGQFGLSLKHFLENGDEVGFYFVNYHERIPNFVLPLNVANEYGFLLDTVVKYLDPKRYKESWTKYKYIEENGVTKKVVDKDRSGYKNITDLSTKLSPKQLSALLDFFTALPDQGGTVNDIVKNFIPLYIESAVSGLVLEGYESRGIDINEAIYNEALFAGGAARSIVEPSIKGLLNNPALLDGILSALSNSAGKFSLAGLSQDPLNTLKNLVPALLQPEGSVLPGNTTTILGANTFIDSLNYRLKYFDNIRLWGATYSTVIGNANVAGEITYRENAPLMQGNVARTPNRGEVIQVNANAIFVFEPASIGSFDLWDFSSLTAEFAGWWLPGKKNFNVNDLQNPKRLAVQNSATGFGYAFLWTIEHRGVTEGLDLIFPIYFNHGVDGAMFTTGFREGQITTAIGVTAKYLDSMEFSFSYAANYGDKDDIFQTLTHDRDNVSFAFKYAF